MTGISLLLHALLVAIYNAYPIRIALDGMLGTQCHEMDTLHVILI